MCWVGGEEPTARLSASARCACEVLESVRAVTTLSVVVVGRTVATLEWLTGCRRLKGIVVVVVVVLIMVVAVV